ncbi:MAG TPA: metallophosphoesterase [Phototrophicaceae bacterium]|nr:metallophosphoesterase [Phototrophicaceae bacterium]
MAKRGLSRRQFLKLALVGSAGTAAFGVGSLAYAYDVEPHWLDVVPLPLVLPRLHPAFDGYRMAHITDLHVDIGKSARNLRYAVEIINELQPDAVVITGDFITLNPAAAHTPVLVEILSELRSKDGVFAVLGNHDHWTDAAVVRQALRDCNVRELNNEVHTLRRGNAALHIAGTDDYWEGLARLEDVLAVLPEDGVAVLLEHEPDFADISAETGRFDLQLSGHSHGGQVVVPFYGPLVLPTYGMKYPLGQYQVGSMIQYTNRGIGTVLPAVRFNCRPEITLLELHSAATAG